MLQNTPNNYKLILLDTLNHYFENKTNLDSWKNFLITLIPKNSKTKFRPISLASCALKLVERMINTRLQHYTETMKLIPDTQNSFRKAKSCQHALSQFVADIHVANNNNCNTCCALIDIKSAFDDVCPVLLNEILRKLNIPPKIRNFIYNLMVNRQYYTSSWETNELVHSLSPQEYLRLRAQPPTLKSICQPTQQDSYLRNTSYPICR